MLWLALHLPLLPLEAFCATLTLEQRTRPVVLLDAHPHQHQVHSLNAAAAERGIQPGNRRATALALAADLLVAERDAPREAAALQAVVHAALAFTPAVAVQGGFDDAQQPNPQLNPRPTVLLEMQASLRLFGGLAALCQRLRAALAPLGHHVQMAAAPTALGAALLAQWQPARVRGMDGAGGSNKMSPARAVKAAGTKAEQVASRANTASGLDLLHGPHVQSLPDLQALLGPAPLSLLATVQAQDQAEQLRGMGLHSLHDLRALPRDGLARRFGQALLDELDRALGLQSDPQRWLQAPVAFETRLELLARADTAEQVLHAAGLLLARLVAWAQARQGRIAAFTLCMLHEARRHAPLPATELKVELAEPALDPVHLQLLLRERLARCTLAAPTLELRLHCRHLVAAAAPNGELFPTRASQQQGLVRLLERLCARLGEDQVQRLVPVADHRPECASRSVPAQGDVRGVIEAGDAPAAALPLHRPAWLLPEPLPLAERDTLPVLQGQPLQLISGPERIETGWWDEHPVARDYFIAMVPDGSLVWVYRGRLPAQPGQVSWYLQGRFA